jgi:hypothetical protein
MQETAIDYHKVKKDVKDTADKAKQRAKEDTAKVAAAAKEASAKAATKAKEAGASHLGLYEAALLKAQTLRP